MQQPFGVLIVEDDASTLSLLGAVARREGFDVTLCADGERALNAIAHRDFDVLVLDLLLPKVNGFEILRHLKCTAPELLSRTLIVTAAAEVTYRDCEDLRRARRLFRKPLDIDDLAAELRACTGVTDGPTVRPAALHVMPEAAKRHLH